MGVPSPKFRTGQYEIVIVAGAGGVGELYRARDLKLGRDVAIKMVRSDVEQEGAPLRSAPTRFRDLVKRIGIPEAPNSRTSSASGV